MTDDSLVVPCRRQPQPANAEVRQSEISNQQRRRAEAEGVTGTLAGAKQGRHVRGPWLPGQIRGSADRRERLVGTHGRRTFEHAFAVDHVTVAADDARMRGHAALNGGQLLIPRMAGTAPAML